MKLRGRLLGAAITWSSIILMLSHGAIAVAGGGLGTSPRLLVLNQHDDSLMVFELPSHRRLATIGVGDEPHELAVARDGTKAYVTNLADPSLSVVDLETYTVRQTLYPERVDQPRGLGITPDGLHLLLTSEGSHRLYLLETQRDVIVRSITSNEEGMHMVAMAPRGSRAFIANRDSDSLSVVNARRLSIERHIPIGSSPEGIAVTPDGRLLLVALMNEGTVALMKPGGDRTLARLPVGRAPVRIGVAPDSTYAVVANRDSDDATVIDLRERAVRATIPVGRRPGGVAIDPAGLTAYVCNSESNTVSVVSIPELRIIDELRLGTHPDGIAIVPAPVPHEDGRKTSRRSRKAKEQP